MFADIDVFELFLKERETLGIKPGLSRMHQLLEDSGFDQSTFKGIHIAGTNGKGSTAAYLSSCYRMCDKQVGVFHSPSTGETKDMIQLNGDSISDEAYVTYANKLLPIIENLDALENPPSPFEIITAIAFLFFNDEADISIIEAGMGGREDSTNVFTPLLSIITSIDFDHMQFLGNSLAEIAYQKAGIIKPEVPVVVGDVGTEAVEVIRKEARQNKAPVYFYNDTFKVTGKEGEYNFEEYHLKLPLTIKMKGLHQAMNAALAVKGLFTLNKSHDNVCISNINKGLKQAAMEGRFEQVSDAPVIILDGAHNLAAINAFVDTVEMQSSSEIDILFTAFKDKPVLEMLSSLKQLNANITFTTFDHPRAFDQTELSAFSDQVDVVNADWQDYLSKLIATGSEKTTYIVGSLTFVGKVRQFLRT